MVDFSATANRIYGMMTDPQATLAYNSQPVPPWRIVAKEHVLPIIVATAVISGLLLWALQPIYQMAYEALAMEMPGFGDLILNGVFRIAIRFADIAIWAVVVGFFAGALGGRNDFNAAYILVALALTPHMVCAALWPIPAIGPLLWLASFIYAMVILYRGAPVLLSVPGESRARHLVLSLVSTALVGIVMMLIFNPRLTIPMGSLS